MVSSFSIILLKIKQKTKIQYRILQQKTYNHILFLLYLYHEPWIGRLHKYLQLFPKACRSTIHCPIQRRMEYLYIVKNRINLDYQNNR